MEGQPNIKVNSKTGEVAINVEGEWRIYGSHSDAARQILTEYAQAASQRPQVSAASELRAANDPLQRGFETATKEFTTGVGEVMNPNTKPTFFTPDALSSGAMSVLGGSLRAVNAPAAGIGEAAGTTVHNLLSDIPMLGGPSGIIPAAGGAISNAVTQLATGNALMKGLVGTGKGVINAVGDLFAPQATREAGVSALAKYMGKNPEWAKRVLEDSNATDMLYQSARSVNERVPLTTIRDKIRDVNTQFGGAGTKGEEILARENKTFTRETSALLDKYGKMGESTSYNDLIMETQNLKNKARGLMNREPAAATAMNNLAADIIDVMDDVSPLIKQANNAYLKKLFDDDILSAMRSGGNPGAKVREIFQTDAKSARRVFSEQEMDQIGKYADKIGEAAASLPSSISSRLFEFMSQPVTSMLTSRVGRQILQNSFTPTGKLTVQGLTGAAQIWRAYQQNKAQGAAY